MVFSGRDGLQECRLEYVWSGRGLVLTDAWPQVQAAFVPDIWRSELENISRRLSAITSLSLFDEISSPFVSLRSLFFITQFMTNAWNAFWISGNRENLVTALIINEQNIIEKPVIKNNHSFFILYYFSCRTGCILARCYFPPAPESCMVHPCLISEISMKGSNWGKGWPDSCFPKSYFRNFMSFPAGLSRPEQDMIMNDIEKT